MSGVPTRACRRFIRRLADDQKVPVLAFTDGDPYGYCNIYRTLKVGSGQAAHINRFFCVPQVHYLGVTPQDIADYKLEDATHPLEEADIKRAKDALKNDPFIQHYKEWQHALEHMLQLGVRIEQQAFAKHGLNFVLEHYLPEKLKKAITQQLKMGVRLEQQAFALHDLNYVMDEYLPKKLAKTKDFLP